MSEPATVVTITSLRVNLGRAATARELIRLAVEEDARSLRLRETNRLICRCGLAFRVIYEADDGAPPDSFCPRCAESTP